MSALTTGHAATLKENTEEPPPSAEALAIAAWQNRMKNPEPQDAIERMRMVLQREPQRQERTLILGEIQQITTPTWAAIIDALAEEDLIAELTPNTRIILDNVWVQAHAKTAAVN